MNQSLLKRIQRLEDIEAIRQLKHKYCYACDNGYDVTVLKALFSQDATWEAEGFGKYSGPEEIGHFFNEVSNTILAAAHLVMNGIIQVDDSGLSASGIWRNIQPVTVKGENGESEAQWMLARYDEKYAKIDNHWFFQELNASIQFTAPYEKGWSQHWPLVHSVCNVDSSSLNP